MENMKISFDKYPVDIILCVLWSFILFSIMLIDMGGILRIILGLPFVIFIPGYVIVFALFPARKTDRGIDVIERVALSIGISLVIVALIGVGLNYTPFGIQLSSGFLSIFIFILSAGAIAFYRWFEITPDERFAISINLSLVKPEDKLDKMLVAILIAVIVIAAISFVYVAVTPKPVEKFTAFHLLGPSGGVSDYPEDLNVGENATVIIGITNHEYQTIDYTVEVWLINQTNYYDGLANKTVYNNAWFIDKINVTLNHESTNVEGTWKPQWEYNYTFSIDKVGKDFKLMFLLFTTPTENYSRDEDYKNMIEQNVNSAHEELYLWINII